MFSTLALMLFSTEQENHGVLSHIGVEAFQCQLTQNPPPRASGLPPSVVGMSPIASGCLSDSNYFMQWVLGQLSADTDINVKNTLESLLTQVEACTAVINTGAPLEESAAYKQLPSPNPTIKDNLFTTQQSLARIIPFAPSLKPAIDIEQHYHKTHRSLYSAMPQDKVICIHLCNLIEWSITNNDVFYLRLSMDPAIQVFGDLRGLNSNQLSQNTVCCNDSLFSNWFRKGEFSLDYWVKNREITPFNMISFIRSYLQSKNILYHQYNLDETIKEYEKCVKQHKTREYGEQAPYPVKDARLFQILVPKDLWCTYVYDFEPWKREHPGSALTAPEKPSDYCSVFRFLPLKK